MALGVLDIHKEGQTLILVLLLHLIYKTWVEMNSFNDERLMHTHVILYDDIKVLVDLMALLGVAQDVPLFSCEFIVLCLIFQLLATLVG